MLWVDKHRPSSLDDFVVHRDLARRLQRLVAGGDCPHMLFYGPPGSGKKTIVLSLLRNIFGPGASKVRVEHKPWRIELPTRKIDVELTTVSSNYHVEMNPSDAGTNDRYVVQEIIKEMAKTRNIDPSGRRTYKVLVLNDVDSMSKEAQHALRRTMEKYSHACRLIMLCSNLSRVLLPVRSRCICVRVPAPAVDEVASVLQKTGNDESTAVPRALGVKLASAAQRNMRRAMLALEACKSQQGVLTEDQDAQQADWELYTEEVARAIVAEQTPRRLYEVRGKLYELLVNCIPGTLILRKLTNSLLSLVDEQLKHKVIAAAASFEQRLAEGGKDVFHLEAFVARVMADYKGFVEEMMGL